MIVLKSSKYKYYLRFETVFLSEIIRPFTACFHLSLNIINDNRNWNLLGGNILVFLPRSRRCTERVYHAVALADDQTAETWVRWYRVVRLVNIGNVVETTDNENHIELRGRPPSFLRIIVLIQMGSTVRHCTLWLSTKWYLINSCYIYIYIVSWDRIVFVLFVQCPLVLRPELSQLLHITAKERNYLCHGVTVLIRTRLRNFGKLNLVKWTFAPVA